jgi:hypothetical protein
MEIPNTNNIIRKESNSDFPFLWEVGVGVGITSVGKEENMRILGSTSTSHVSSNLLLAAEKGIS